MCLIFVCVRAVFFFFKQKTAYELRISDWSSDVCSSDLVELLQVREISAGDSGGYNATFTAERPMRVGVLNLGYADGYLRGFSGQGRALAGERALPVLGRVSMDLTVIDLAAAPDLREGDHVTIDFDLPRDRKSTRLNSSH